MPAKAYTLYQVVCPDHVPRYFSSKREASRVLADVKRHMETGHLYKIRTRNLSGLTMVLSTLNGRAWIKESVWVGGYEAGQKATEEDALEREKAAEEARKEVQTRRSRNGYVQTYGPGEGRGFLREVRRKAGNRPTPPSPAFKRW